MRFEEGRAWFVPCPRCDALVLEVHVDGLKMRFSRKGVPSKHAAVIQQYHGSVVNIFPSAMRDKLWVSMWHRNYGKPDKGRLHIRHLCGYWK